MNKHIWKIILVIVLVVVAVLLLRPPAIQMQVPSPTQQKVALLKAGPLGFGGSRLYVVEADKQERFIGTALNNYVDSIEGLIWNPDETKLAIANNYDGCPCMIVIIDLNDTSGKVTVPAPYGLYSSITTREVRHIIQTRHSIRSAVPSDLEWLSPQLAGMRCEHGNFLDDARKMLHADQPAAAKE